VRPNPRMQRTPSAPLMRKRLGGLGARAVRFAGAGDLSVSRHRDHHVPPGTRASSFCARYAGQKITVRIEDGGVEGSFPPRALGHVMEWWSLHRAELAENWQLAQEGRQPKPIDPLE